MITQKDFENFNISNFGEISKYITSSSESHFQTNALEGVDQGMASITLRGLDHASTLLLVNSKRHTFAGTPSNQGEGYIDVNIIPEIAIKQIEILKEGATREGKIEPVAVETRPASEASDTLADLKAGKIKGLVCLKH